MDNCQKQSSDAQSGTECQNLPNKNSQHAETGNISNVLATLEALRLDFEKNAIPEGDEIPEEVSTQTNLKNCVAVSEEESLGEEVVERAGKIPGKRKRRTKSKKKDKKNRSSDGASVVDVGSDTVNGALPELLSDGNILILDLLSMDTEEREEYLMKTAMERNLVVFVGKGNRTKLELNPVIYSYFLKKSYDGEHVRMPKLRQIGASLKNAKDQREPKEHHEKGKKKFSRKPMEMSEIESKYLEIVEAEAQGPAKILPDAKLTKSLKGFAAELVSAKGGTLVEGEIRVSVKNYHNSYMANPTGGKDIIFRSSMLRRHALPGDHVLALIFKTAVQETKADAEDEIPEEDDDDEDGRKTSESSPKVSEEPVEIEEREVGVVIEILKEGHNRLIVGTFQRPMSHNNLLTPRDSRLPRVRITTDDLIRGMSRNNKMMMNFIFLAKIMYSSVGEVGGKLLRIVGQVGELKSENRAILLTNDLNPESYPAELLAQLPPNEIRPEDFRNRMDLRTNTCIFTIDPLTARDLDDAVSCVQVDKDIFEVGVHIADVAHFIPENSPLDLILQNNTTSIYMVDTVYHMLPLPMCLACSLLPGKDRLAFSVFWRMDSSGNILEERIAKSVINSCTQFAYEHAQMIIDSPEQSLVAKNFPPIVSEKFHFEDVVESVRNLHRLSRKLRGKRLEAGAVKMDQPKISFQLDPKTGQPQKFHREVIKESNELIEEFMLLANITVAKWIHRKFPDRAVLRCHDMPDRHQFNKLANDFKAAGVEFDLSSTSAIAASLDKAIEGSRDKEATKTVLTCMLTKPMLRARYFCSGLTESDDEFRHYLLSIPIYTHFTSPIRRYPDILVHRLLAAAEGVGPEPALKPNDIQKIANTCNVQKFNAKCAGNDSINLYFMKHLENIKKLKMRAAVFKVGLSYVDAILIDTGHHLKVTYAGGKATFKENVTPKTIEIVLKKDDTTRSMTLSIFTECEVIVTKKKNQLKGKLIWL